MADRPTLIVRARLLLPLRRPPIENGAVVIRGDRLAAVGNWRSLRARHAGQIHDLGEVILMPGLVNAHCHLDYTDMAGLFAPPRRFSDWIKLITTEKAHWTFSDYAQSWINGANMLVRSGSTTVADIEAVPELLPDVWSATPLRVFSFLEMTGVRSRRDPDSILREAAEKIDALPSRRCHAGLSPHAPYSTTPKLLQRCAAAARRRQWRVTTHIAESATEFEMFRQGSGEMFDWLKRNQRIMTDCGKRSPVQQLAQTHLLGPNLLAVHVNYLAPGDAALLARKRVSVVHCPRSHDFFQHQDFPFAKLNRAGVNLCLGTDSLATVTTSRRRPVELNLFAELRQFAKKHPGVPAEHVLRMATLNGARALGMAGDIGELSRGAFADLIALPFAGKPAESYAAAVEHTGDVAASMIDGHWAIPPK